jgi:hypothetical protein
MNIIQALDDQKVFAEHFRGDTWNVWRVFLAALFALPMTAEQLAIYTKHTGRNAPPTQPLHEGWLICGRRSGKSFTLACTSVFLSCFKDWRPHLGPGEIGTVMIIAADRRQARVIMRYCLGLLKSVPMLKQLIESETRESITLRNRIAIEVHTASFRSTRGYTIIAALLDEIAYWPTDEASAQPDVEVINAVRPGMATIPGAILLCASSPHARKGALWSAYAKHFGKENDPILVWQAATRDMNATVPQSYIDAHLADDPARASAEYLAQFRSDLESWVSREVVEASVGDYFELPPAAGYVSYYAAVDPAGGSGGDSFALSVAHREGQSVVVDLVRERRPPFMPSQVIDEFIPLLKSFRIGKVVGDKWAGGFPPEAFQKGGIRYEPSKLVKSDIYRDALPLLNSGRITLPKNDRLFNQLISLERHVARGGHDVIDHPQNQHDDLANAAMGAAVLAAAGGAYNLALLAAATSWDDAPDAAKSYFEIRAERAHRELLRRYGAPVSLNPLEPEKT